MNIKGMTTFLFYFFGLIVVFEIAIAADTVNKGQLTSKGNVGVFKSTNSNKPLNFLKISALAKMGKIKIK